MGEGISGGGGPWTGGKEGVSGVAGVGGQQQAAFSKQREREEIFEEKN
jgi:hypothetical protein